MSWGTPRGSKIIASEVCESAMSAVGSTKRRSKLGKSMTATVSNTKNHSGGSESDVAQSCLTLCNPVFTLLSSEIESFLRAW